MAFTKAGLWGPEAFTDARGNLLPSATVRVFEADGTTPAAIFADAAKATPADNPFEVGADGNGDFYADPGTYVLEVTYGGEVTATLTVAVYPDPSELVSTADLAAVDTGGGSGSTPGQGMPAGGSTGQVLTKVTAADYDTTWSTPATGGGSGDVTQVNGKIGDVVLDAGDVGADPAGTGASAAAAAVTAHNVTTSVHGIADTSDLIVEGDARLTDERTPISHQHGFGDLPDTVMYIDELTEGEWSADPPARSAGDSPKVLFTGLTATSNPKDVTNGVTTPANVLDTDWLVRPLA